jgi:hypothetical protein
MRTFVPDDRTHFGGKTGLASLHPRAVAEQRVDLAVVGQQAERLRQLPGGERVGRVALVEHSQSALVIGIAQIGVERRQLVRGEQTLVHERAAGQAGHVEAPVDELAPLGAALDLLAREVQLLLERFTVTRITGRHNQRLANAWQGRTGCRAELVGVNRDVAPTEESKAVVVQRGLDYLFALQLRRQKEHAHTEQVLLVESGLVEALELALE